MQDSWKILVDGFGPFDGLAELRISSGGSGAVVLAGNGQGKTCLSRLFRAAEAGCDTLPDALVSRGRHGGRFMFEAMQNSQSPGALVVDKERGESARVDNQTGLLFHVFNGDYVQENLAERHYAPSGDIRGYLMGKTSIELDAKRRRLEELGEKGKAQRLTIERAVKRMQGDLKALGISPRLKEFSSLNVEHIEALPLEEDDYDGRLQEYASLRSLPDDARVEALNFNLDQPDFDEMCELLATSYSRELFSDDFHAALNEKRSFIMQGLNLREGDACPFCGQSLGDQAQALIHLYEDYLSGREALVVETLESEASSLARLKADYLAFQRTYQQRCQRYDSLKAALGEKDGGCLAVLPNAQVFCGAVDGVIAALRAKTADISVAYDASAVEVLEEALDAAEEAVGASNERIHLLNAALQKGSIRLREIKRALCQEAALRIRNDADGAISELVRLREDYRLLRNEIRREESEGCLSKRDAVAAVLEELLHEMFDDKYRFDCEGFSVVYQSAALAEEADEVLSDGEKAALAFCHYVASSMELLNAEADLGRLCFVVDDPSTGLDELHTERIVRVIEMLRDLLGLSQMRLLVLTHDMALAEMLRTSDVALSSFTFDGGSVRPFQSSHPQ